MQEGCKEQGRGDLPVEGATDAVRVGGPDDAIAVRVEEGAVLFEDLGRLSQHYILTDWFRGEVQSDVDASLPSLLSLSHMAHPTSEQM